MDLATLPGPPSFLSGPWIQVTAGCITGADVAAWPHSVSLLCEFSSFLGSLHWPADTGNLGHYGVSYLEVLWAGHRLLSEKVTRPRALALNISISSVPGSEESKLGRGVVSSVVWCGLLASFLEVWAGFFCHVQKLASFQAASYGVGAVFAWLNVQTVRVLSSSVPQGSLCG